MPCNDGGYLWLMFCHEAAKDGFFHMDMHGHAREVRVISLKSSGAADSQR